MPMPSKYEHLEALHGKPMETILIELYEQYPNGRAVAAALGVDQATLSKWLLKLGLQQWTVLRPMSRPASSAERRAAGERPLPGFEGVLEGERG